MDKHKKTPDDLLTGQAVNLRFAGIKEKFKAAGIDRPIPFIRWQHSLTLDQEARLQQAFCARATKADAELAVLAERTLEQMVNSKLKRA